MTPSPDPTPRAAPRAVLDAVDVANVPTLLMVLVQLTGDLRWLDAPFRPRRPPGLSIDDTGGLPDEVQREVRDGAKSAIAAWFTGTPPALPEPSAELMTRMLSVSLGEDVPPECTALSASMLVDATAQSSGPAARPSASPPPGFRAIVIGAGVSGIAAGVQLDALGVDYRIYERDAGIGGTWLINRYPGCGVDTPSHLYSYSFAPADWTRYFAHRDEVLAYLEHVVDDFGLLDRISLQTSVERAVWDDTSGTWSLTVRHPDGSTTDEVCTVLISAVGAFGTPVVPDIPGRDGFEGRIAHTARWPEDIALEGKRVAVIGNGASAMQLVPAIAGVAAHVDVYQRSPQWTTPIEPGFAAEVPAPVRRLLQTVPLFRAWLRIREAWIFNDKAYPTLQIDPAWPDSRHSLNAESARMRRYLERHLRTSLGESAMLDRVVPDYPPFGKRMLLDHGWYSTITRDDVTLRTDPIDRIDTDAVVTADGSHPADVIVFATGFDVVRFLASVEIVGRSGTSLREAWDDDDARAYLGTSVSGFPNLFVLYGPNTQAGHGGSLMFAVEAQLTYVVDLLRQMFEGNLQRVEVRKDVFDEYNERVDEAHAGMVWAHPGMTTYYRNARGRVVVNSPWRVVDFWTMTRSADLDDFETA
ncbi:flavin-containing monooxygenase [Pseudonocardia sp. GCM10023141]|uniref:flavin-containing monooxygenase n=1 Tax=Pseudonocardia sp. GCM10023141 TaxID=3252653 RepID=UPI003614D805